MSSLGELFFTLGLDDEAFNKALDKAKERVANLGADVNVGVKINVEDIGKQLQSSLKQYEANLQQVKDALVKEQSKKFVNTSEIDSLNQKRLLWERKIQEEKNKLAQQAPTQISVTPNLESIAAVKEQLKQFEKPITTTLTLEYDTDKFQGAATMLKNYTERLNELGKIRIGIDDSFLKSGVGSNYEKGVKGILNRVSDYLLDGDSGDAGKSIKSIQSMLDNHTFKIKAVVNGEELSASINNAIKKVPVGININDEAIRKKLKSLNIPLDFNVSKAISEAKAELKKHEFKAKLNLVVDKAKVSKAIKEAFAKKGLEYNASPSDVRNARILEIQQRMEHRQAKFDGQVKKSKKSMDSLGKSTRMTSDWATQLNNQFNNFISIYAIEHFIRNLYTIGGEFQKQQIALRSMIGDVDKGNAIFERMKQLSVKSPFTFSELSSYTKQMTAFGIEYEELYNTTKRLADISAGVGVDMGRLILAYGQVRSAEVLRGQELRQFTEAGIPIVAELAKKLSEVRGEAVKTGEVFEAISKREISFGMVKDVLFDMTDPGGRFFEMQEELSKSLAGQWSNLRDAWDIFIADVANGTNNVLTGAAQTIADMLRNWREWIPVLAAVTTAIGVMTTAIRIANVAQVAWNAVSMANPWAIAATVIIGAAGALGGWAIAANAATQNTNRLNTELENEIQKWSENRDNALRYIDTLKASNTSEERRIQLYNELLKMYPKVFENMKMEQVLLADSAKLKTSINEATRDESIGKILKQIEEERRKIREAEGNSVERGVFNGREYKITRKPLTDEQKSAIAKAEKRIAELEKQAADIQKNINRADAISKLTPDSSIEKYIEVYNSLGKAVKILRQGGVKGEIANPKEFTTTLEYYDQLNSALREQEDITKKFNPTSEEHKRAAALVSVYRNAINAINGIWEKDNSRGSSISDEAKKDIDAYLEALKNEISKIGSQWNLFKDLLEASGNRDLSEKIAFGGNISFKNQLEQLKSRIIEEAFQFNIGIKFDELIGLGEKQLLDKGVEEKAAKAIGELIEAYNKENTKLKDESIRNFIEILKASNDFEQQIVEIERKLQQDLEDLRTNALTGKMGEDELKRREDELKKKAQEDISGVRFKEFKESSDWVKVFDDLDRVSNATLENMIKNIEEFAKQANLSEEVTKQLVEAMAKLREEAIDRNPFEGFKDALGSLNNLRNAIKGKDANGNIVYMVRQKDGSVKELNQRQYDDGVSEANEELKDSALAVADKFKAVADASSMINTLFENMGIDLDGFIGALSRGLSAMAGGATQGASIASAFGAAGPWGAIAGAAVGMLSEVFASHDRALQREIDASESREKYIRSIADNLESELQRSMGGLYNFSLDDDSKRAMDKLIDSMFMMDVLGHQIETNVKLYSEETRNKAKEAIKDNSYFDAQWASLLAERDELKEQVRLENAKKKSDSDKLADYEQEIRNIDVAIKDLAKDMAESLYGINFKDWSRKIAESLVDAWASGEDAAEAYRKTVNEILKDVGVSLISQKILEPIMEKTMDSFLKQFEADDGTLTDSSMKILADMYNSAEYAASATEAYLDGLKKLGIDFSNVSDEAKDGLSKGIQGVTEDTANLLGSYMNAMRQDLSVNRSLLEQLIGLDVPKMSYLAEAQLRELGQITANTKRNADAADKIYDLVNRVVDKGSNKLKV